MQREWVDRLTAVKVIAEHAGHLVHWEAPPLAAAVLRAVIAAACEDRPVTLPASAITQAGGTLIISRAGGA